MERKDCAAGAEEVGRTSRGLSPKLRTLAARGIGLSRLVVGAHVSTRAALQPSHITSLYLRPTSLNDVQVTDIYWFFSFCGHIGRQDLDVVGRLTHCERVVGNLSGKV